MRGAGLRTGVGEGYWSKSTLVPAPGSCSYWSLQSWVWSGPSHFTKQMSKVTFSVKRTLLLPRNRYTIYAMQWEVSPVSCTINYLQTEACHPCQWRQTSCGCLHQLRPQGPASVAQLGGGQRHETLDRGSSSSRERIPCFCFMSNGGTPYTPLLLAIIN